MKRDRDLERRLLAGAPDEFARLAVARLDVHPAGEHIDADNPGRLLAEIAEEGLDVAAWTVLARQVLARRELTPEVERHLARLVELGAEVFAEVERALAALEARR